MVVGKRTDENVKIGADTAAAERGFKKLTKSGKAMVAALAAAALAAAGAATKAAIGLFRVRRSRRKSDFAARWLRPASIPPNTKSASTTCPIASRRRRPRATKLRCT